MCWPGLLAAGHPQYSASSHMLPRPAVQEPLAHLLRLVMPLTLWSGRGNGGCARVKRLEMYRLRCTFFVARERMLETARPDFADMPTLRVPKKTYWFAADHGR